MAVKQALVCLGDRKRSITFLTGVDEKESMLEAIREVFKDVVTLNNNFLIQLKNEKWGGEFLDLAEETIQDQSILHLIVDVR